MGDSPSNRRENKVADGRNAVLRHNSMRAAVRPTDALVAATGGDRRMAADSVAPGGKRSAPRSKKSSALIRTNSE